MKNNIKVSIIVPVYNTELYIEECLKSLICQTYKNLEIIVIDDGSTDNSSMICSKYEKNDSRIIFKSITNSGVSAVRNIGIKIATGDYIMFVDSDDYLQKKSIEMLINFILKNKLNLVRYDFQQKYKNRFYRQSNITKTEILTDKKIIYNRLINTYDFSSACLEIINAKLIKNMHFDPTLIFGEDYKFNVELFKKIDKVGLLNECFYIYRINPNSITHNFNMIKLKRKIESCKKSYQFLIDNFKHDELLCDECKHRYFIETINCLLSAIGYIDYQNAKKLQEEMMCDENVLYLYNDNYINKREKQFIRNFGFLYIKTLVINKIKETIYKYIKFYIKGEKKDEKYNNNIS